MAQDVSIASSGAGQVLNKDLDDLYQRLTTLNATRTTLQVDADSAKKTLQEAQAQFERTGAAADKMAYHAASGAYDGYRIGLEEISHQAQQAEKDILSLGAANSRLENRAGSSGSGAAAVSPFSPKVQVDLGTQLGTSIIGAISQGVGSTYGERKGSATSTILSATLKGAAAGSAVSPGVGTVVGTAVGLISGIIEAGTKDRAELDDIFRSEVKSILAVVEKDRAGMLSSGLGVSQQWTASGLALETMLPGKGEAFQKALHEIDRDSPFDPADIVSQARQMLASGMEQDQVLEILNTVASAAGSMGLNAQETSVMASAINSLRGAEELTQEDAELFALWNISLKGYVGEAHKNTDFLQVALGQMAANDRMQDGKGIYLNTMAGSQSALDSRNAETQLRAAQGYEEVTIQANQREIAMLDDGLGEGRSQLAEMAARGRAERESLQRQYLLDAENAVLNGGEISELYRGDVLNSDRLKSLQAQYQEAVSSGDNLAAEKIYTLIQSLANAAFQNSETMSNFREAEEGMIAGVQESLMDNSGYLDEHREKQDQLSKGVDKFSVGIGNIIRLFSRTMYDVDEEYRDDYDTYYGQEYNETDGAPYKPDLMFAMGKRFVAQAKETIINITGNEFIVRHEADIDAIFQQFSDKIQLAGLINKGG